MLIRECVQMFMGAHATTRKSSALTKPLHFHNHKLEKKKNSLFFAIGFRQLRYVFTTNRGHKHAF